MERQLLATILITFLFVSCQQIEVTQSPAPVIEKSNLERKLNSENNGIKIAQNNIIKRVINADTPVFSSSHKTNKPIQIPNNKLVKVITGILKSKFAPNRLLTELIIKKINKIVFFIIN